MAYWKFFIHVFITVKIEIGVQNVVLSQRKRLFAKVIITVSAENTGMKNHTIVC